MKAVALREDGGIYYGQTSCPEPGHGKLLIRVRACGIDRKEIMLPPGTKKPLILGYECAGEVEMAGDERNRFLTGKKVCVLSYLSCGICEFCRKDRPHLCVNAMRMGQVTDMAEGGHYDGALSEFCVVDERQIYPFERISFEEGAMMNLAAAAMWAILRAGGAFAKNAVVIGSNPMAMMLIKLLGLNGAGALICALEEKESGPVAQALGADEVFEAGHADIREHIFNAVGARGAELVFDTVGTEASGGLAFQSCKKSGVIVNTVSGKATVSYRLKDFSGERSIMQASPHAPGRVFYDCLRMAEQGRLDLKPLIKCVPVSKAAIAFAGENIPEALKLVAVPEEGGEKNGDN